MTSTLHATNQGIVYLIGAGPGDPGLITVRGAECLQQADIVIYDRLISRRLLAYAPQAELVNVGKLPDHHPVPQSEINQRLIDYARSGKVVARLKGGDPFVFGRGGEEAQALAASGIRFEIVPGVTSAIAVPAYAGIPVTFRNLACSVAFITGHRAECAADQESEWRRVAQAAETLVFLMGVHNLPRIVAQLLAGGRPADTPAALIQQGTHTCQRTITATLADIVERGRGIIPPAIFVVGKVVSLQPELNWFEQPLIRPLQGMRVINTRPVSRVLPARPGILNEGRDEFSRRLTELGAEPLELPAFEIIPNPNPVELDACLERLKTGPETYDWLIFTSANAVHAFFRRFFEVGLDLRVLGQVQLGVIGTATGAALQSFHLQADFVPGRFTGATLAEQLPASEGQRILVPRSAQALPDLPAGLLARGMAVDTPVAYQLQSARADPELLQSIQRSGAEAACFFSPSAVSGLADFLAACGSEQTLLEFLSPYQLVYIGPTTAQAAGELGLPVDLVAEPYSLEGMLDVLIQWHKHS